MSYSGFQSGGVTCNWREKYTWSNYTLFICTLTRSPGANNCRCRCASLWLDKLHTLEPCQWVCACMRVSLWLALQAYRARNVSAPAADRLLIAREVTAEPLQQPPRKKKKREPSVFEKKSGGIIRASADGNRRQIYHSGLQLTHIVSYLITIGRHFLDLGSIVRLPSGLVAFSTGRSWVTLFRTPFLDCHIHHLFGRNVRLLQAQL